MVMIGDVSSRPTPGMSLPCSAEERVNTRKRQALIEFLQHELALPRSSIQLALRQGQPQHDPLPMVLWQYGLVTLAQLDQIFDWLEEKQHEIY